MQGRAIWAEGPIHPFDLPSSSLERGGQALKSGASKTHAYMDEEVGTGNMIRQGVGKEARVLWR